MNIYLSLSAKNNLEKKIKEYNNPEKHIELYIRSTSCCSGPNIGMAFDYPSEDDTIYNIDGITFIINKVLEPIIKSIYIDYYFDDMKTGFKIQADRY